MSGDVRHFVRLHEPEVATHDVTFGWTVTPASTLYQRTSFTMRFPDNVPLDAVPAGLWWRVALVCLHAHWALLRPCQVELPVRLAPGEREFWLRLIDLETATLAAYTTDGNVREPRAVTLVEHGPALPPLALDTDPARAATAFSGGKDSLVQAGLLAELTDAPLLVATSSPVWWARDHVGAHREHALQAAADRLGVPLVEVSSDFRSCWDNDFPKRAGGSITVNELTDTFLYLAATIAVAAARGVGRVFLASEAEVQENAQRDGVVVQHPHFAYAATTLASLDALLAPAGLRISSLTHPLHSHQVQALLWDRYPALADLQFSCWMAADGDQSCSACGECRTIGLRAIAAGRTPRANGIDPTVLLTSLQDWSPEAAGDGSPHARVREALHRDTVRALAVTPVESVRITLADEPEFDDLLTRYDALRDRVAGGEPPPAPGYHPSYLPFVEPGIRDGLAAIVAGTFPAADPDDLEGVAARARAVSDEVAAALAGAAEARPGSPSGRPPIARPPEPVRLTDEELASIAHLIPDPEPELRAPPNGNGSWAPDGPVPVSDTLLTGNERRYLMECLDENYISSTGRFVGEFEAAFSAAVGTRHAVACTSGTAALHLALAAGGIGPGDEVLIPTFTMIATANTVRHLGGTPVFVDAEPDTRNIDPDALAAKLTSRTRAIVPVHTYGHPANMDAIGAFAERNGLLVIEDAAEAHGAEYRGRRVGSIGHAAAFSFYGNKILTSGEGGIVATDDDGIAEAARSLRGHGFSGERHFWHRRLAFNYRITNLQAAVGLAQTEQLDALATKRRTTAARYGERLQDVPGLRLPHELDHVRSVHWMYAVTVDDAFGCSRDELRRHLADRGIETRTFFVPMHLQPIYFRAHRGERYPVAEELGRTGVLLPSGPGLTDEVIDYVARSVVQASTSRGETARPLP
jgi:perosamine synthetase